MRKKILILSPEILISKGPFKSWYFRYLKVYVVMFGKVLSISVPLYPCGKIKPELMVAIDEALKRLGERE